MTVARVLRLLQPLLFCYACIVQEQKPNYHKQLETLIKSLAGAPQKPRLLLHACCGPCSSAVIEYLATVFSITIFYYNPNIYPQAEYNRRLAELKKFVAGFPPAVQTAVSVVQTEYTPQDFFCATNACNELELQTEPERGERCRRCYAFRMKKAWNFANQNGFDFFTTTLSISPHKDAQKINAIGMNFAPTNCTRYVPADFKKRGGFLRSLQLSAEYGLYRQDYCGCIYSYKTAHPDERTKSI